MYIRYVSHLRRLTGFYLFCYRGKLDLGKTIIGTINLEWIKFGNEYLYGVTIIPQITSRDMKFIFML